MPSENLARGARWEAGCSAVRTPSAEEVPRGLVLQRGLLPLEDVSHVRFPAPIFVGLMLWHLSGNEPLEYTLVLLLKRKRDSGPEARVQNLHELRHTDLARGPHLLTEGGGDHRQLHSGANALLPSIGAVLHVLDVDVTPVPLLELDAQWQAALHVPCVRVYLALGARANFIGALLRGASAGKLQALEDAPLAPHRAGRPNYARGPSQGKAKSREEGAPASER
mmetsp:Transcript_13758/g.34911  ORF Transcript_13758/g.34911 Transcript_13758/m.34911 type:complete len:223 (-) Transcript_13758:105-773(-)